MYSKTRYIVLFAIVFLTHSVLFAQDVDVVLKKIKEKYASLEKVEYTTHYQLFKGHNGTQVKDSYEGYVYRNGKSVYQKIGETEFVYGADYYLHISHKEKALVLDLAQQNINLEIDLKQALQGCKNKTIEEEGNHYIIQLEYQDYGNHPYSKIRMKVRKSDYLLSNLGLYYKGSQDFSNDRNKTDYAQPYLNIEFSKISTKPRDKKELFEFSNYISSNNGMLNPSGDCVGYELIDNRVK